MRQLKGCQAILLSIALVTSGFAGQSPGGSTQSAQPSASELQSLVAPIALYPDGLIAQILAGATYPTQIVEADRWIKQNSGLKGEQLGAAIDKQPWDPSVKGLGQFPSVLDQMSKNLSWTSALGDAYFNDPESVMKAVQVLRNDARNAGTLKSTPEQTVSTQGQTIIIEPAQSDVVYVPTYSPAAVYGTAIDPYPGYSGWDAAAASLISFGVGTMVGAAFGGWGWGWGHWGANWGGGSVTFNRNNFVSRSNTFANRNTRYGNVNRGNINRGNYGNRNLAARPGTLPANRFTGNTARNAGRNAARNGAVRQGGQNWANRERQSGAASRGFGQSGAARRGSGAFGGYRQGGSSRLDSSRGRSSFGGGRRSSGGGGRRSGGGGRRGGGGGGRRGGGGGGRGRR